MFEFPAERKSPGCAIYIDIYWWAFHLAICLMKGPPKKDMVNGGHGPNSHPSGTCWGLDMLRHDSTHMDSEVPHNWTWSSSQTVCLCILTQINCLPVSKVVIGQNNCRPKMDGMVLWATAWLCTKPLTSHIWLVFELINQTKWWAWHSPHDFHGPIHFEVDWGVLMLPSGKHTKNYGKSPFLMGKSAINGSCSITMLVYQRVNPWRNQIGRLAPGIVGHQRILVPRSAITLGYLRRSAKWKMRNSQEPYPLVN